MAVGNRGEQYVSLAERYTNHKVLDRDGDKIGKVDDLFVDEKDELEYVGVKMGFLGTRSTLIPAEVVHMDDEQEVVEVSTEKETVKEGPTFGSDEDIDPEFERRVREHYELGPSPDRSEQQQTTAFGAYYSDASDTDGQADSRASESRSGSSDGNAGPGMSLGDRDEDGELHEHPPEDEGVSERESDLDDEDELRVERSEEELRTSKRERETGSVNVRKRVRTEREQKTVPTRHEEAKVERVPASGEASEAEIGEEEVTMPLTEEEVETSKRPVKKEEIRVRKDAVEGEETVEEEVRKEEVDVEDDSERS